MSLIRFLIELGSPAMVLALLWTAVSGCADAPEKKTLTLHVFYPETGLLSSGMTDTIHNAVVFGRWQFSLDVHEVEPCAGRLPECDFEQEARNDLIGALGHRSKHPHLLIALGEIYADLLTQQGCDFDGTHVLYLDGELNTCPGLRSVAYRTFGPAFLAGVAAVEQLRTDLEEEIILDSFFLVGVVSDDSLSSREYVDGFSAGVRFAGGEVSEEQIEIVPPDAPESLREATKRLLEQGTRVIMAAGGDLVGTVSEEAWRLYFDDEIQAVDGDEESAKEPIYVIGVDDDQNMLNSQVMLGSVVKHPDHAVCDAMFDATEGEFLSGATTVGFDDGAVEFIYNRAVYRESVQRSIEAAQEAASEAAKKYQSL